MKRVIFGCWLALAIYPVWLTPSPAWAQRGHYMDCDSSGCRPIRRGYQAYGSAYDCDSSGCRPLYRQRGYRDQYRPYRHRGWDCDSSGCRRY